MQLTTQQISFFDTFGYLVLPGLVANDIDWITSEFEAVFQGRGVVHDGSKRSTVVPFIDQREQLSTLLDHPNVTGLIGSLIGDDFNHTPPLLGREPRELAGRPIRIQAVYAAFNQPIDVAAKFLFVDLASRIERDHVRSEDPVQFVGHGCMG